MDLLLKLLFTAAKIHSCISSCLQLLNSALLYALDKGLSSNKYCIIVSSLKQCVPMSGLMAKHIPASSSVFEVDDFNSVTDYHEYEDPEQLYDADGPEVEEILEDSESEDEEEIEEYLKDADDDLYDADDGNSVSSVPEDEEGADTIESFEACDIVTNEEICESKHVNGIEDIVPQNSHCDRETAGYTSKSASRYCCFNNTVTIGIKMWLLFHQELVDQKRYVPMGDIPRLESVLCVL